LDNDITTAALIVAVHPAVAMVALDGGIRVVLHLAVVEVDLATACTEVVDANEAVTSVAFLVRSKACSSGVVITVVATTGRPADTAFMEIPVADADQRLLDRVSLRHLPFLRSTRQRCHLLLNPSHRTICLTKTNFVDFRHGPLFVFASKGFFCARMKLNLQTDEGLIGKKVHLEIPLHFSPFPSVLRRFP